MNLNTDQLLPKLRTALERIKSQNPEQFYAWKITIKHYQSLQTLMLGTQKSGFETYQNRDVLDHSYQIDVYSRHGTPRVMGDSTFSIDPLDNLESQVQKTFNNSLLVGNKSWDLPTELNGIYEKVTTVDPMIAEGINIAHQKMQEQINTKLKTITKLQVNSGELYTNLITTYFETSMGLSGQKASSEIYFEMAMEKLPLPNTQEVLKYKKALSIEDANLPEFIEQAVHETLGINETKIPKTSDHYSILIDGEAISNILSKIVYQLNAQREDDKSPFMKAGDQIFKSEKKSDSDKVTITLDPSTPVMALSTPFTEEGMKPIKAVIVKDDIVTTQVIHHKIGQYLAKTPNYIDGNMLINLGTNNKEQLLKSTDECLEIISFSSLLINPNTLTWSSEIKLGKFYINGKFDCMMKGGVISGDIKENLNNFKFSNIECKINEVGGGYQANRGYIGPDYMLIKSGVKVVGE
jgi:predicted Zn-dependent protease